MYNIIKALILLTLCNVSNAFSQRDSLNNRTIGIGTGYYHYASINEISEPYIFSGGNIGYLTCFKSITQKYRFDCSFNYSSINRTPANVSIPEGYRLINRDDGHVYQLPSVESSKETKILNLTFGFYRLFKSVLFKNDHLGLGITEKTSAILTNGNDDPELVSSSLNPGIVYNVLLKNNFNIHLRSNISVLSIYSRRSYASVEGDVTTKEQSDFEFIKNHLKLSGFNDYFEVFSELELSKKISPHFNIQLGYTFLYLSAKSPRQLSAVSNITNIGVTYKF